LPFLLNGGLFVFKIFVQEFLLNGVPTGKWLLADGMRCCLFLKKVEMFAI